MLRFLRAVNPLRFYRLSFWTPQTVMGAASLGVSALGMIQGNAASRQAGRALDQQNAIATRQADLADRQQDFSEGLWDRYLEVYDDLERGIAEDADAEPDYAGAATRAQGDVAAVYGGARDRFQDSIGSYGIDPGSGRFASSLAGIELDRARSEVGAINESRRNEDDQSWARRTAAVAMGRNLPSQAQAGLGQAGATLGQAASTYAGVAGGYNGIAGNQMRDAGNAAYAAGRLFQTNRSTAASSAGQPAVAPRPAYDGGNVDFDSSASAGYEY